MKSPLSLIRHLIVISILSLSCLALAAPTAEQLQQFQQLTPAQQQQVMQMTPDQRAALMQMTPEQRAALAAKMGGNGTTGTTKNSHSNVPIMQPRTPETGNLEGAPVQISPSTQATEETTEEPALQFPARLIKPISNKHKKNKFGKNKAANADGTAANADGTAANADGTAANADGTAANADGTSKKRQGAFRNQDGTSTNRNGSPENRNNASSNPDENAEHRSQSSSNRDDEEDTDTPKLPKARPPKILTINTDKLQQFGYELFANQPTSFEPATDIPVPPEYVLGPGDEIKVQMFGKDNQNLTLTVDRDGVVSFPQVGPVSLAGLRFSQAKATLADLVKQKMIGVSVSITMGQLRSIRVFALGDVFRPGSYTVSGLSTLSNALFASGGVKKMGSLRNIQLKRGGKTVTTIDLYDFLLEGNTRHDVRLLPGDVVFVPPIGKTVSIAGEVVRPAIYELSDERTVGDVLKLAGGLMPDAYTSKALIERFNASGEKQVLNIDLTSNGLSTGLRNGDVIKVFPATDFETNQILLVGNVKRPGKFAWHAGMKILDLIHNRDDLLPESLLDYGIIESEAEDTHEPMMTRFKLGELMDKGTAAGTLNLALKPRDRVYVFQRANFREQPQLQITGSVQTPGSYEYKRNMHLADLILAAGGLLQDADPENAELYHTDFITKNVSLVKVNLKQAMAGDSSADLLLENSDRLVVHSIFERKTHERVSVDGEVHNPLEIEMSQGMRLADLVFAAGNVTEMAFLEKGELTRYRVNSGERRESEHFEVDLGAALRGEERANILLQANDELVVRRIANWTTAQKVQIHGEVKHPGSYPIQDGERLSSVLSRTGGYTNSAYLQAAVFTRESIRMEQQKQIDDLVRRMESELGKLKTPVANLRDATLAQHQTESLNAADRVLAQLKEVKATGRLVLELADIAALKGSSFDIQLRDGDTLTIPKRPDEILVLGEVYNQSAFIYEPSKSRKDYLNDAGPTRMADLGESYIVRANGRIEVKHWFSSNSMQPGDTIVVPLNMSSFNLLDSVLDWSRATMQIATSMATLKFVGVIK